MKNQKEFTRIQNFIQHWASSDLPSPEIMKFLSQKNLHFLDLIAKDSLEEKIVSLVLEGHNIHGEPGLVFDRIIEAVQNYSTTGLKTIIFGGGAGLSSILDGDIALNKGAKFLFRGLKNHFPQFTVAVCTTDDGGSSGNILRYLPIIAPGDLRRAIISSITPKHFFSRYPLPSIEVLEKVVYALKKIINYRFGPKPDPSLLKKPSRLLGPKEIKLMPKALSDYLNGLGKAIFKNIHLKQIPIKEQCLGNLFLVSSIYGQEKSLAAQKEYIPSHETVVKGIQSFAEHVGAGKESIYPACTTQGELQFLYKHGVINAGEHKSSKGYSTFPVHRTWVHFANAPRVDKRLIKKIEDADLIIYSPGSLYTSLMPILQLPGIIRAIRRNRRALKILGANFWAQRGETDISGRRSGREYYISELLEAYHNNISGGISGLFDTIIVSDLQSIPGDILRNYTMEGKVPIFLDKQRVKEQFFPPVEAAVFYDQKIHRDKVIRHDSEKFAMIVKTLCFLRREMDCASPQTTISAPPVTRKPAFVRRGYLCDHWRSISKHVKKLDIQDDRVRQTFLETLWQNREILLEHLLNIEGIQAIPANKWARSTEWDKILGYYDPEDGYIKIHQQLLISPERWLIEDLLIALGESLLGNYIKRKSVRSIHEDKDALGKIYEIELRPAQERKSFLHNSQLIRYLHLARLQVSSRNPRRFYMLINNNEAFIPAGLLFGLLYAWYLNNRFGGIVDSSMSLLRWEVSDLIPKPTMDRIRMQQQIEFFRQVVFRQKY